MSQYKPVSGELKFSVDSPQPLFNPPSASLTMHHFLAIGRWK